MTDMIANKSFVYNCRRLMPGQDFQTKNARDTKILTAIGKARVKPVEDQSEEISALREEYQDKVGKRAFHGWDAATLREKIEAAD